MQVVSKYGFLAIAFSMLAGCASSPSVPFSGSTAAGQQLSSDVYKMLALYTHAQGCKKIDAVHTTVVEPPAGAPGLMKTKSAGYFSVVINSLRIPYRFERMAWAERIFL